MAAVIHFIIPEPSLTLNTTSAESVWVETAGSPMVIQYKAFIYLLSRLLFVVVVFFGFFFKPNCL